MTEAFADAVRVSREETASYAAEADFRSAWLGISARSRDYLAQQLRAFGALLEPVTASLAGWKILDVGCGDGRWLRRMVELDARPQDVVGVDVSDVRFDIGRAKNPLVQLIQNDGSTLPFEDDRFDLVTEFVCFSNIPGQELRRQVAAEIQRVTKPGGYVFWWDRPETDASTDPAAPLDPADYFHWPMCRLQVGERPLPSETLRPFRGLRLAAPLLDRLRHPPTHVAALIGPKPAGVRP